MRNWGITLHYSSGIFLHVVWYSSGGHQTGTCSFVKKNGEVITNPLKTDWEEAGFEPGKRVTGQQILIQEIWSDSW